MFNKFKNFVKSKVEALKNKAQATAAMVNAQAQTAVAGTRAEAYVDTAVKIIIVVVLGLALLAALTLVFNDDIIPGIREKIQSVFDYDSTMA